MLVELEVLVFAQAIVESVFFGDAPGVSDRVRLVLVVFLLVVFGVIVGLLLLIVVSGLGDRLRRVDVVVAVGDAVCLGRGRLPVDEHVGLGQRVHVQLDVAGVAVDVLCLFVHRDQVDVLAVDAVAGRIRVVDDDRPDVRHHHRVAGLPVARGISECRVSLVVGRVSIRLRRGLVVLIPLVGRLVLIVIRGLVLVFLALVFVLVVAVSDASDSIGYACGFRCRGTNDPFSAIDDTLSSGLGRILGHARIFFRRRRRGHGAFPHLIPPVFRQISRDRGDHRHDQSHQEGDDEDPARAEASDDPRRLRLDESACRTFDCADASTGESATGGELLRRLRACLADDTGGVSFDGSVGLAHLLGDEVLRQVALGLLVGLAPLHRRDDALVESTACRATGHLGQRTFLVQSTAQPSAHRLPQCGIGIAAHAGNAVKCLDSLFFVEVFFLLALTLGLAQILFRTKPVDQPGEALVVSGDLLQVRLFVEQIADLLLARCLVFGLVEKFLALVGVTVLFGGAAELLCLGLRYALGLVENTR